MAAIVNFFKSISRSRAPSREGRAGQEERRSPRPKPAAKRRRRRERVSRVPVTPSPRPRATPSWRGPLAKPKATPKAPRPSRQPSASPPPRSRPPKAPGRPSRRAAASTRQAAGRRSKGARRAPGRPAAPPRASGESAARPGGGAPGAGRRPSPSVATAILLPIAGSEFSVKTQPTCATTYFASACVQRPPARTLGRQRTGGWVVGVLAIPCPWNSAATCCGMKSDDHSAVVVDPSPFATEDWFVQQGMRIHRASPQLVDALNLCGNQILGAPRDRRCFP